MLCHGLFDKAAAEIKERLNVSGAKALPNDCVSVSLHPKLSEDLDACSISIFENLVIAYLVCKLTNREKKILISSRKSIEKKFRKLISFHLDNRELEVAGKSRVIELAPIEMQESLAILASELGSLGFYFFNQILVPFYVRLVLAAEEKKLILDDLEQVEMSFRSLLLSCAGREMDDTDEEEA